MGADLTTDPEIGSAFDVLTTEPGIQLYVGNLLDGYFGKFYVFRNDFCLETIYRIE